jgi:hypothetical protein
MDIAQFFSLALEDEKDAEVRRGIVFSIRKMEVFGPHEIQQALLAELESSPAGSPNQAEVLKAIAKATADLPPEQRGEYEAALKKVVPSSVSDRALREELAKILTAGSGWPFDLVASWLAAETDPVVRTVFVQAWSVVPSLPVALTMDLATEMCVREATDDAQPLLLALISQLRTGRTTEADAPILRRALGYAIRNYGVANNIAAADALIKEVWVETPGFYLLLGRGARYAAESNWDAAMADYKAADKHAQDTDARDQVLFMRDQLRALEQLPRTLENMRRGTALYRRATEFPQTIISGPTLARWKLEADLESAAQNLAQPGSKEAAIATLTANSPQAVLWLTQAKGEVSELAARLDLLLTLFPEHGLTLPESRTDGDQLRAALAQFAKWYRER